MDRQVDRPGSPAISYPQGGQPIQMASAIEFVGGPYAGRRESVRPALPGTIAFDHAEWHGVYRRSVRCADDGALRYTWQE